MNKLKYIDLFCGMGSFHYSFKKFGWKCLMACDLDVNARAVYKLNYNIDPLGDICNIDPKTIPKYDILCAGFPCQPFSQAGQQRGFQDKRGNLFFEIMKFVNYHHPSFVILENVSALITHDNGNTFNTIRTLLENQNYNITFKKLVCSDYGIPQMRKRIFIIAVSNHMKEDINCLLDMREYKKTTTLSNYLNKNFEKKTAYTIRCGGRHSPINDRHNWDGYMVDGKEYRLSINDALNLQGFNSDFKLMGKESNKWRRLGNTIPTIFTYMIANNIIKFVKVKDVNKIIHLHKKLSNKLFNSFLNEFSKTHPNICVKDMKKIWGRVTKVNKNDFSNHTETKTGNIGENQESNKKNKLSTMSTSEAVTIFGQCASEGITVYNIEKKKAPSGSKADFNIKMNKTREIFDISYKTMKGAKPSILNTTTRDKFCSNPRLKHLLLGANGLDSIISKHYDIGNGKEEVSLTELNLNEEQRKICIELLTYFMFYGSGKGESKHPANSVMIDNKFTDCRTDKQKEDFIKSILNNCVFCMRSCRNKRRYIENNADCKKWIYKINRLIVNEKTKESGKHRSVINETIKKNNIEGEHIPVLIQQLTVRLKK